MNKNYFCCLVLRKNDQSIYLIGQCQHFIIVRRRFPTDIEYALKVAWWINSEEKELSWYYLEEWFFLSLKIILIKSKRCFTFGSPTEEGWLASSCVQSCKIWCCPENVQQTINLCWETVSSFRLYTRSNEGARNGKHLSYWTGKWLF